MPDEAPPTPYIDTSALPAEIGTATPNQITVEALKEAAEREQLPRFESLEALYEDLEI